MKLNFTNTLTAILLLFFSSPSLAQTGIISGTVSNQQKEAVVSAHVSIKELAKKTITNEEGQFIISEVAAGTYTLEISNIGFKTKKKRITIKEGEVLELDITLKTKIYESPTVVVTATRSQRDIEDVPVPVSVVAEEEIENSGSMRLSDVLAEQTGLTLTSDHGTGVQVQGFDSDYTLIMLNGQPLVGRTAGTFDLSRISVGNVKQVEMMKGPSSALWGSDAMAGVINIITEQGRQPFEADISTRYGTNQTLDLGTNISWGTENWQNTVSFNRNSSKGYRLVPGSISQTVPNYQNYTGTYRTDVELADWMNFEFQGRYYRENQQATNYIGNRSNPTLLDSESYQEDFSINPTISFNLNSGISLTLEHYTSTYETENRLDYQQGDSLYQIDKFNQTYNKSEIQASYSWNANHISTVGSGLNWERLKAQRYKGTPQFSNAFIYGQHEWFPTKKLDLIAGFRYDNHSEYTSQLSPKLSARYKVNQWLHIRGSAGRGFKAPEFRQLFLSFNNSTVGYSVYGSSTVKEEIQQLQQEGKISQILIPLDQLNEIKAERSWAYNAGIDLYPFDNMQVRINGFRNNVNDLIETAPVAQKTNGQSAFTYFNLEQIYTQGIETELRWQPIDALNISMGYQLLDAQRRIEDTKTVQDQNGNPVQKEVTSYEPLFNRSKHSANVKIFYQLERYDIEANLRGRWRSQYGRIDSNGNGYVDSGEYEDGYTIWNTAASKTFADHYKIQLGIDNIFDFTRPQGLSFLPGRTYYAQISIEL